MMLLVVNRLVVLDVIVDVEPELLEPLIVVGYAFSVDNSVGSAAIGMCLKCAVISSPMMKNTG